jgi:hypothetical protein
MSLSHSPKIVTDGLVLCLDAANPRSYPKSGTTWSDLAGSNDGTMQNMEDNYSDEKRGVLNFDGSNEYVDIATGGGQYPDLTQATWSFWVKFDSFSNAYIQLAETIPDGNSNYQLSCLVKSNAKLAFYAYNSIGNQSNYDGTGLFTLSTNKWYNLTYVFQGGSRQEGYVNGILDGYSATPVSTLVSLNNNIRLSWSSFAGRHVDGSYSNVLLYSRALTADEVRQNYNATKRRFK